MRTIKEENATGTKDVRQICIDAGVPATRFITGVHAGSEVINGSASFKLTNFKVWWRNGASTTAHTGQ